MSLKEARRIIKRLRKAGILATIRRDTALCNAQNPTRHQMCGNCIVEETAIAKGQVTKRIFWE